MASGRALAEQVLAFDPDLAASRALAKRKVLPDMQHPVAGFFGFKPSDQALPDTSLYRGALSSPDNSPRARGRKAPQVNLGRRVLKLRALFGAARSASPSSRILCELTEC